MPASKKKAMASDEGYCRRCKKIMPLNYFYEATNLNLDTNGRMSICKKCCNEIFDQYFAIYNDLEKAIYLTCQDLDIRFNKDALKATRTHIDSALGNGRDVNSIFGVYKSKLSSIAKQNGLTSFRFRDSDKLDEEIEKELESDFVVTPEIIEFWGAGFNKSEYEFLQNKYNEYAYTYECETPVMREYLKQAAFECLEIHRRRIARDDATKNLQNLNKILESCNIKPNQSNGFEEETFGTLIKKWENEEPIPEPDPAWQDVDGIGKYIRVYFLGHLCKMLGIKNEYAQEYEEEMARFRVERPDDTNKLEEMEDDE